MVGGSTRISEIRQRLENTFGKDKLKFDINPDEAVAHGAAIAANVAEVWQQQKYFGKEIYFKINLGRDS